MKITTKFALAITTTTILAACGGGDQTNDTSKDNAATATENKSWYTETYTETDENGFRWKTERFADIKILRYQINGWDKLTSKQKELVYYITQAGYAGKEIIWDQNYRHNLTIRRALERPNPSKRFANSLVLPSLDAALAPSIVPLLPLSKVTFPEKSILMAFSLLAS